MRGGSIARMLYSATMSLDGFIAGADVARQCLQAGFLDENRDEILSGSA